eukprot:Pgem_evm1s138
MMINISFYNKNKHSAFKTTIFEGSHEYKSQLEMLICAELGKKPEEKTTHNLMQIR